MALNIKGNSAFSFIGSLTTTIVTPFQTVITSSVNKVDSIFEDYVDLVDLRSKNIELSKEIERLKSENSKYLEINSQYQRLIKLLDLKKDIKRETVLVNVVGIDPLNWSRMVFINQGENDGVKEKSVVLTHEGLVGHVVQTAINSSKVLLITDVRSAVDVLFQETRTRGMFVGLNKDYGNVKYVPISANIKEGDKVVTSGLGGIFPKGLPVGTIRKVEKEKYGLFQKIELVPSADLSKLEEVMVISR